MKYPAWLLLVLAACSTPGTTDNVDSTEVAADTAAQVGEFANFNSSIDTTYTETLAVVSAFSEPQIKATVAYVYSESGLDVYEQNGPSGGEQKVIGHVDYRSVVTLSQPLVNNLPSDTMMMHGLKGHLVEMSYEGKPGFVFSGYLVNLPVPVHPEIAVYFDEFLHLLEPATSTTRECDCDAMASEEKYLYEQGIVISNGNYYESYDHTVTFPDSMTLQEVFLFARYFFKNLKEDFPEFPTEPYEKELEDGKSMIVEAADGKIVKIVAVTGEGCYEEEGVQSSSNGLTMSANGGC